MGRQYAPLDSGVLVPVEYLGTGAPDGTKFLRDDRVWAVPAGAGGAPTTADYLTGTAQAGLSAEIVVGSSPGGELGGTWASPTVDATHSGSTHHTESHASRHAAAGADAVKLDDLAAPDDNTDLNVSTSAHGLMSKLPGGGTNFFREDGTWAAPSGSGAPASVDYLVGTADGGLSAEIVVGTTPGGELGGTWGSPTVDATHSGSAHTDFIAKAIVDAKGDLIVATAADTVARKAVGANGTHLAADSAQGDGLVWEGSAWADYTPALTAVTTNPTLGSSTITGRWRSLGGKTIIVYIALSITTGGAWNAGSGEWKFSLPSVTAGGVIMIGTAQVLDAGVGYFSGTCQIAAGGTVIWPVVMSDDTGNRIMANAKPITWATGDRVYLMCIIETT